MNLPDIPIPIEKRTPSTVQAKHVDEWQGVIHPTNQKHGRRNHDTCIHALLKQLKGNPPVGIPTIGLIFCEWVV